MAVLITSILMLKIFFFAGSKNLMVPPHSLYVHSSKTPVLCNTPARSPGAWPRAEEVVSFHVSYLRLSWSQKATKQEDHFPFTPLDWAETGFCTHVRQCFFVRSRKTKDCQDRRKAKLHTQCVGRPHTQAGSATLPLTQTLHGQGGDDTNPP